MAEASGEEERQKSWSELPPEVGSLIFSHLFLKRDHIIFGAVCKSWKSVTAFRTPRPLPLDFSYRRSPFLMALKGDRYNFFHPICASYYLHIPELSNKRILDSKYGWLLMAGASADDLSIFFFHPSTKERIDLPNLPCYSLFFKFGFCYLPTSPECVVVAIASGYSMVEIGVTKPGEENWNQVEIRFRPRYQGDKLFRQGNETFHISCTPVFHDGNCYCLDVNGKVVVFDPKDIAGSWNFCGKPYSKVPHNSVVQSFMVESDGEMLTVFLNDEGEIWICKLNPTKKEWTKVEDLGNKVMYVSNGASWAERATFKGMGNKIYLPMLYDDNAVMFYCLATRRFHSNGNNFSRKNLYHMKQLYHSTWIKPWWYYTIKSTNINL